MARRLDMNDIACALGLIFVLGLILVILNKPLSEGFTSQGAIACNVNNPCSHPLKCINGFCAKTDPRALYEKEPVPVLPDGQPLPYT